MHMKAVLCIEGSICEGGVDVKAVCDLCPPQVPPVLVPARPLTVLLSPCITQTAWATSLTMVNMRFSLVQSAALVTRLSTYTPAETTA